jgi:hypothetical protein
MAGGFRGPNKGPYGTYAGVAGADLENAPQGPVPFTSPFGIPVSRIHTWTASANTQGANGGVPGQQIQRASGNPAVMTAQSYENKSPYGGGSTIMSPGNYPGQYRANAQSDPYGGGQNSVTQAAGRPQFGQRAMQQGQEQAVRAPGNAPVGYSNDKLVTYDRHAMMKVGYENSGRKSGNTDPPMDGPARPSLWLVQRTLNYQQGTDTTGATDDLTRDYTRNASGMYVGTQGQGWSGIYGGTPGLYQEYGSYEGISPSTPGYDPTTGESQGIVSPVGQGAPGDGPQTLWGGPPHGLHSPTLPSYDQTIGRYMAIPQMAQPRIDRPSNSPIAGQSYSQTVQPQGQTGTSAGNAIPITPSYNRRAKGNGWRGRAAG